MTRFALTGARIFDGEAIYARHAVVTADGAIEAVVPEASLDPSIARHYLNGGLLAPGFIDVQVNGGGGALFNADPSVGTVRRIARAHRRFGTTGMLPTLITDTQDVMAAAAAAIAEAIQENVPGVLGIHFEGPFLDPRRRGAHEMRFIRRIAPEDVAFLIGVRCGAVLVTLAPSAVAPDVIETLAERGIIVSLGHAEASANQALAALRAGAHGFTHLFNAMSQLAHRAPGMVGAALADRESHCGIIADGHHVDPLALKIALAAKAPGKLMLVTDAMPTAAGGPQAFLLQGREVLVRAGRLELPDGTLAGSNLTMDEAVRYCCASLDVPLAEALRMASLYPAAFLKRDRELGRLASGYRADIVHLADDLHVQETWIGGRSSVDGD